MKTSRIIQFAITALLASIGCALLLTDAGKGFATLSFCLSSLTLYRRSELSRPVPSRELWTSVGVLAVLAAAIILANHFIPRSSSEHFVHQPVVAGIFWAVLMAALFWRWKRERRLSHA